jgi:peroxiredoxin Q/BCP
MPPKVNEIIPDFTLPDQDNNPIRFSDLRGKPVVLFFYPRANTPGCTIEACGFRDQFLKLQRAGVVVLGISRDTPRAQKKFQEKYALPYPLLADADQKICKLFGRIVKKTMYGKPVTGVARTTYVIGPDQRILHIFEDIKPAGHAEEVLAYVKGLKT